MKIYVFGNQDANFDKVPPWLIKKLQDSFKEQLIFEYVKPNEDLPFDSGGNVVILDTVRHLKMPKLFDETDINSIAASPRNSVHDFDLGFQLKYLLKLGKITGVKIVGVPMQPDFTGLGTISGGKAAEPLSATDGIGKAGKTSNKNARLYSSIHSIVKKLVAQDIQGS
jgi:hypothetical protein